MAAIVVEGGQRLRGRVKISGAKNAALPMLAASVLAASGESRLSRIPALNDIHVMLDLLQSLGVVVATDGAEQVFLRADNLGGYEAPYELVNRMRASTLIMGPLLARLGRARISLPGGCAIGNRPIDLHLQGFKALGAEICTDHGYVEARAKRLLGAHIYLDYPSVGATENIMMAACLAEGTTIIENAAAEPEIVNLADYLSAMGACIGGAGSDHVEIMGVKSLQGAACSVIPDRIEAATYLVAGALAGGPVTVGPVNVAVLQAVVAKLREIGCLLEERIPGELTVLPTERLRATDVTTLPYPGFPTDLQPQFVTLLTQTEGAALVLETVFENRFRYVSELLRMGAEISTRGRQTLVRGPRSLTGTRVLATDLRAGAALVLAGLVADGQTFIADAYHIDRGYVQMAEKLQGLGARIERLQPS